MPERTQEQEATTVHGGVETVISGVHLLTNTDGSGKAASYVRALVRDNGFPEIANQCKDDAE